MFLKSNRRFSKIFTLLLCICLCSNLCALSSYAASDEGMSQAPPSAVQIRDGGGSAIKEDISVSKTIRGTECENLFDITLEVRTHQDIEELYGVMDMAVVVVMDISNTMTADFGNTTRYEAAMSAADSFIDKLADTGDVTNRIGYVAFNTNACKAFDLSQCSNAAQAQSLKNSMRTKTGAIIKAEDYEHSHNRFTNIEGGLKMAGDMLSSASNKHKHIIFLSDGFPTTYLKANQNKGATYYGYDPYCTSGKVGRDGVFYDDVLDAYCKFGTSYSDKAAVRARQMAYSIKSDSDTLIFSIGVDVGGQTIKKYVEQSNAAAAGSSAFSVVDRINTSYDLGSASGTGSFKKWLRNSIGSGYYYDSSDQAGLSKAYAEIFDKIKELRRESLKKLWTVTDPITSENSFIHFWDKDGMKAGGNLSGENVEAGENTAIFSEDTIKWDLKNSGFTTAEIDGKTIYSYQLKYRIRLENESANFIERANIPTNETTTLTFQKVTVENNIPVLGAVKKIDFPIPAVEGYLSESSLIKSDSETDVAIEGAEFTLTHAANCTACAVLGDHAPEIAPVSVISDNMGNATFENIPSGHSYVLEETEVPLHYADNPVTHNVEVAYDVITIDGIPYNSNSALTVFNYPLSGLTVTKDVIGCLSEEDFSEGSFSFEVKNADDEIISTFSLPKKDSDDNLSWSFSVEDLPAGKYTVTEKTCTVPGDNYECTTSYSYPGGDDFALLESGTDAEITVTNNYSSTNTPKPPDTPDPPNPPDTPNPPNPPDKPNPPEPPTPPTDVEDPEPPLAPAPAPCPPAELPQTDGFNLLYFWLLLSIGAVSLGLGIIIKASAYKQ